MQHGGMRGGWVYIMTNRPNGTLYLGVTGNIARRAWEHREGMMGRAAPGVPLRSWVPGTSPGMTWGGARGLPFFRHGRTCSTAVRFGWAGPGARRWYRRITGASAGSGHGLRHALTCLPCSPLVTPDLFRGPGLPRTPIRGPQAPPPPGFPGPRNKSGVTTGGRRRSRPLRQSPPRRLNRTAMDLFRASTGCSMTPPVGGYSG